MNVTRTALKHIRGLRSRRHLAKGAGLRLGLRGGSAFLRWDPSGPGGKDMVVTRGGLPFFIDARTYLRLSEFDLDYESRGGVQRFLLRRRGGKP